MGESADVEVSASEYETTVTYGWREPVVYVYSNIPSHVRRMRADDAFTEMRTFPATKGIPEGAQFTIPRSLFDPMRGRRRPRGPKAEVRPV